MSRERRKKANESTNNTAQSSEAAEGFCEPENADEDDYAWGSVNERASATASTTPQQQVSLRSENGGDFEVSNNASIYSNAQNHWQEVKEMHVNKNDTVFTDRNDENPSLSNTTQRVKKKASPMLQNLFHKKERERDAMRRENENRKRHKEKEMNELAMKSLKADIDQFTKEIRGLKEEIKQ